MRNGPTGRLISGHSGFEDTTASLLVSRLAVALVCALVMVAALLVILSNVFHIV